MAFWQRFRDMNVAMSWATTPSALWRTRGFAVYDLVARAELGLPENRNVMDVGGGRTWPFGRTYHARPGFHLTGIDIAPEELALNLDLHERVTADVCRTLHVADGSLDLIVSRALIEHLHDTVGFLRAAERALKPGGRMVLMFAGKWAFSTILNRLLSERLATALLHALVPNSRGYQGFKAYYDKVGQGEFKRAVSDAGLIVRLNYPSYYSSSYFQFFWPLHVLSILHDQLRQFLSIDALTAINLFVLEKPNADATLRPLPMAYA